MADSDTLLKFDHPKEQSSIIKVIGVGGGGSNAVNHMYKQGIHGVDFMICNTDAQAIEMSPVPVKIQLGQSLTAGNGAGSNPEVGMNAAIENIEDIREVLARDTRMVFITAGMGGGTGTGGAPVIAKLAREMDILTIGIVTIPFSFEGRKRRQLAETGIQELRHHVDTLLVINNDKLRELHGNLKLGEAFAKADNILTDAARGIAEIITHVGYINVDFEDVKTVMKSSGVAIMGTGVASGENRATEAVEDALNSPLLNDNQITGASNVLLYIAYGNEGVRLDEVTEITDYIQKEAGSSADIIWGSGTDDKLGDAIAVTIIATGFHAHQELPGMVDKPAAQSVVVGKIDPLPSNTPQRVVAEPLVDNLQLINRPAPMVQDPIFGFKPAAGDPSITDTPLAGTTSDSPVAEKTSSSTEPQLITPLADPEITRIPNPGDFPGALPLDGPLSVNDPRQAHRQERLRQIGIKLRTLEGLMEVESIPAFKRKNTTLDQTIPSNEQQSSNYTLDPGDDPNISENPFYNSKTD
ncbi:MAG TPA: cell division protein FtsZ [Bacteroidales bacterium]|nr:cell division protein FtsZ [Bacteroidales bacterium]HRZ48283.1 cell division protein FtsZ [Bacteroidales bacterium]